MQRRMSARLLKCRAVHFGELPIKVIFALRVSSVQRSKNANNTLKQSIFDSRANSSITKRMPGVQASSPFSRRSNARCRSLITRGVSIGLTSVT